MLSLCMFIVYESLLGFINFFFREAFYWCQGRFTALVSPNNTQTGKIPREEL